MGGNILNMYNQNQPQQATSQYVTSQYNPQSAQQNRMGMNNASQYAQKNNYYQASAQQGGGVNQYGAHYTSSNRDEDVGNAYYQAKGNTSISNQAGSGQYTSSATLNTLPNVSSNNFSNNQYGVNQTSQQNLQNNATNNIQGSTQYARNNNYYQASAQQGGGVNQYGAHYTSGNRDEDVGNAYYQSQGNTGISNTADRGQYTSDVSLNTLPNVSSNNFQNNQYGTNQAGQQNMQNNAANNIQNASNTPRTQYAQKNNYYQASAQQGGGVNQYGAHYTSGNRDEDVGNAYYQAQGNTGISNQAGSGQFTSSASLNTLSNVSRNNFSNSQYGGSQVTPQNMQNANNTPHTQYGQKNNYYQASAQQGDGVNQYGAHYSSGIKDEDVSNTYYNSSQ